MNREGISLGWNCSAAQEALLMGLRKNKSDGYNTCPFDMMISNYIGICECIKDDFKHFCDPKYLELRPAPKMTGHIPNQKDDELWVYNTYYNFVFNHESPYHGNLYLNETWSSPHHFVENNFKNFIERYNKRIESFRNYLNGNNFIDFVLVRYNSVPNELENIIKEKNPNLKFKIHTISRFTNNNIGHLYNCTVDGGISYEMDYLEYMGINQNNNPMEIKRYLSDFNDVIGDINENITII